MYLYFLDPCTLYHDHYSTTQSSGYKKGIQMSRKRKKVKYSTFVLRAYDDDFPSTLFAGWLTVSQFKAKHIAHAKKLGKKLAKKLRWNVWKVHKKRSR